MPVVVIDSKRKDAGQDSTSRNYDVSLSKTVRNVRDCELVEFQFPKEPVVITGYNDVVGFYAAGDGAGATIVYATLTQGYYTNDEFVAMLNNVMGTAATSATFTSTFDGETNKMTLIADENVRFAITSGVAADTPANEQQHERALRLVGAYQSTLQTAGTSTEQPFCMDLESVRYYTVEVEMGFYGYSTHNTYTSFGTYSFILPSRLVELGGTVRWDAGRFTQDEPIGNADLNKITLKIYREDYKDLSVGFTYGKHHMFVLNLISDVEI